MAESSEELIRAASRGDVKAGEALLAKNLSALHAFIRLRAGEVITAKESCSDLVQSVCREILGDLESFEFRGEAAFRKWLFQHALHKVIDRHRYYRMHRRDVGREARAPERIGREEARGLLELYGTVCTPSRDAIAEEEIARIEAAFEKLGEPYREIITLCRLVGLSRAEAAEQTGRTEGQVRGILARGVAKLARLLEES